MMRKSGTDVRKKNANPVGLAGLIVPLIRNLGIESDIKLLRLQRNWRSIVGEVNARNTRPIALDDTILTVAVSSPAWLTQARFISSSFLSAVNSFEPLEGFEIGGIRFILDGPDRSK